MAHAMAGPTVPTTAPRPTSPPSSPPVDAPSPVLPDQDPDETEQDGTEDNGKARGSDAVQVGASAVNHRCAPSRRSQKTDSHTQASSSRKLLTVPSGVQAAPIEFFPTAARTRLVSSDPLPPFWKRARGRVSPGTRDLAALLGDEHHLRVAGVARVIGVLRHDGHDRDVTSGGLVPLLATRTPTTPWPPTCPPTPACPSP